MKLTKYTGPKIVCDKCENDAKWKVESTGQHFCSEHKDNTVRVINMAIGYKALRRK